MIVSFPHMGNMHIVLETLLKELGQSVCVPPPISKRTLELGARYSPETVCLPFKIMLGNFIEALEQGADTLISCGGKGPCRLGYYAEVQREILSRLGYRFEMIVIEPQLGDVVRTVRRLSSGKSWLQVYRAFQFAGRKLQLLDDLERRSAELRPVEYQAGSVDIARKEGIMAISQAAGEAELKLIWPAIAAALDGIAIARERNPLKIGLVGEIYVMLEPFINQDLERRLGALGVEVHKTMYLSDYVKGHLYHSADYRKQFLHLDKLAKPYLGHYVGGHGLKSVAYSLQKAQEHFDGVIQVYPFTCMPEVVAKNILHQVSNDADLPVLTLAFDEQSGDAGIVTRLEAFIDLLHYRRSRKPQVIG